MVDGFGGSTSFPGINSANVLRRHVGSLFC